MTAPQVWLLDLDGVLIEPLGYRRAVQATVLHFAHRLGLEPPTPTDPDMAAYEAYGITSEWDMTPLMLAALLEAALAQGWEPPPTPPEPAAPPVPREQRRPVPAVDYRAPATRVAATLPPGAFPAAHAGERQRGPQPLFPRLAGLPRYNRWLFAHSRDVGRSTLTRAFQHYVLGPQAFAETYGQPPDFDTPAFLATYDRPLPPQAWLRAALQAWRAGRLALAVMTARPSRPPGAGQGYAPEAELALARLGWPGVPHIGYGHVRAAHAQGEGLLKPHPVHALAALHAALNPQAAHHSVAWAQALLESGSGDGLPPALDITVAEDSPPGLHAARAAAEMLQARGVRVRLRLVGVAGHEAKRRALAALGARLVPRVDAALTPPGP